jgi:hypothetical protein
MDPVSLRTIFGSSSDGADVDGVAVVVVDLTVVAADVMNASAVVAGSNGDAVEGGGAGANDVSDTCVVASAWFPTKLDRITFVSFGPPFTRKRFPFNTA